MYIGFFTHDFVTLVITSQTWWSYLHNESWHTCVLELWHVVYIYIQCAVFLQIRHEFYMGESLFNDTSVSLFSMIQVFCIGLFWRFLATNTPRIMGLIFGKKPVKRRRFMDFLSSAPCSNFHAPFTRTHKCTRIHANTHAYAYACKELHTHTHTGLSYVTWLIYLWCDSLIRMDHDSFICYMAQSYLTRPTHSYVTCLSNMWHGAFICDMTRSFGPWLIHTLHGSIIRDTTHSFICEISQ